MPSWRFTRKQREGATKKNMAQVELIMPKMGESIMEATILRWVKKVGDKVALDETVLEIATDKVDSEVPSPIAGVIAEILYQENDVVPVGKPIALIATEGESIAPKPSPAVRDDAPAVNGQSNGVAAPMQEVAAMESATEPIPTTGGSGRFYSPLVKNIAKAERISLSELEQVPGSGMQGRVTKKDILAYVENRSAAPVAAPVAAPKAAQPAAAPVEIPVQKPAVSLSGNVEIVEMDRMRKLIADHMVMSKRVSPHVTSFVEVDVTNMVNWRDRNKGAFEKKYGEKITYTPIFIEAIVRAIRDFPMINVSVDETRIIVKKDVNIGMATALPTGNLIVPVIKNADQLNLIGLTKAVNDLAGRARNNKLKPEEIQDGTFTLTNVGTFGNVMGTPIINQPQVAIMAAGAIRKKPAVVETEYGDLIAVRQMMFLSMSYDHRVVDGFLGGSFLRRVADYLEAFDAKRDI
jgi:2-oxoglutarate dehydrogenase E2 component (dihydrolipoamide succinyltransferase)